MASERDVLDSLVRDACEMQRVTAVLPRPQENLDELVPIVDRLVKKNAEDACRLKPKAEPKRERPPIEQIAAAYKKAGGVGTNVRFVEPSPIVPARPKQTRAQRKDEKMRRARLRLLWSKPDWQVRLKSVDILAAQGMRGPQARVMAESQYVEILKDSERVFGPYWKGRAKKHYSTGNGKRGAIQS